MAKRKRALAALTFAWTLAAAGMAAFALSSAPLAGANRVADIQVGERGNQTRIALICEQACTLEKRSNDEFILHGALSDASLDLAGRLKNLKSLSAAPGGGGSVITIVAARPIEYANTKNCTVGGLAASCIDFFFTEETARAEPAPPEAVKQPEATAAVPVKVINNQHTEKTADAAPALREAAPERFQQFARLAPPERLAPPANLAKVQPVRPEEIPQNAIATPTLRSESLAGPRRKPEESKADYAARVRAILGKELSGEYCLAARDILQEDPWALDAMVDVGLCSAAKGDMTGAEDILSRLLEYTPDNYEAHVGRALIAVEAGEKSVAKRYFQDALDALPPIEESNRIVQAMKTL